MLWPSIASVAALTAVVNCQYDGETSPPSYPSPWMRGGNGWADAYQKAQAFVSQLTLLEKVNLTTGVGWEEGPCVGNTGKSRNNSENTSLPTMLARSMLNLNSSAGSIPRLNFPGLCLQDSPLGVRDSKFASPKCSCKC